MALLLSKMEKRSTFYHKFGICYQILMIFFAHLCYKGGFEVDDNFKPKIYKYEGRKKIK